MKKIGHFIIGGVICLASGFFVHFFTNSTNLSIAEYKLDLLDQVVGISNLADMAANKDYELFSNYPVICYFNADNSYRVSGGRDGTYLQLRPLKLASNTFGIWEITSNSIIFDQFLWLSVFILCIIYFGLSSLLWLISLMKALINQKLDCQYLKLNAVILISFIGISLTFMVVWYMVPVNYRNYFSSTRQMAETIMKHQIDMQNFFAKSQVGLNPAPDFIRAIKPELYSENQSGSLLISLWPLQPQERDVGTQSLFVSKSPWFEFDYVRLNVDCFNFLFFSENITEKQLRELNSQMSYTYLGNGVWHSKYWPYIVIFQILVYIYLAIIIEITCLFVYWLFGSLIVLYRNVISFAKA